MKNALESAAAQNFLNDPTTEEGISVFGSGGFRPVK